MRVRTARVVGAVARGVAAGPSAPTANNDTVNATVGQTSNFNVLANDSAGNVAIDAGTLTIVSGPTKGTAAVSAGKINYTPNATGADSLTYRVSGQNGLQSNTATVNITNAAAPSGGGSSAMYTYNKRLPWLPEDETKVDVFNIQANQSVTTLGALGVGSSDRALLLVAPATASGWRVELAGLKYGAVVIIGGKMNVPIRSSNMIAVGSGKATDGAHIQFQIQFASTGVTRRPHLGVRNLHIDMSNVDWGDVFRFGSATQIIRNGDGTFTLPNTEWWATADYQKIKIDGPKLVFFDGQNGSDAPHTDLWQSEGGWFELDFCEWDAEGNVQHFFTRPGGTPLREWTLNGSTKVYTNQKFRSHPAAKVRFKDVNMRVPTGPWPDIYGSASGFWGLQPKFITFWNQTSDAINDDKYWAEHILDNVNGEMRPAAANDSPLSYLSYANQYNATTKVISSSRAAVNGRTPITGTMQLYGPTETLPTVVNMDHVGLDARITTVADLYDKVGAASYS